jgi:hypothetical protein
MVNPVPGPHLSRDAKNRQAGTSSLAVFLVLLSRMAGSYAMTQCLATASFTILNSNELL